MNTAERNTVGETIDILHKLGGNNGFSNLQPKIRRELLRLANELQAMLDKDISRGSGMTSGFQAIGETLKNVNGDGLAKGWKLTTTDENDTSGIAAGFDGLKGSLESAKTRFLKNY